MLLICVGCFLLGGIIITGALAVVQSKLEGPKIKFMEVLQLLCWLSIIWLVLCKKWGVP